MVNFMASQRSCATRGNVNHRLAGFLTQETSRFLFNQCFLSNPTKDKGPLDYRGP
jgi:hypothetical protein